MAGYKKSNVSRDTRRPIALPLLEKIVSVLPHLCFSNFETALFQSAFTLAFFCITEGERSSGLGKQSHYFFW
jgi:hypothetical protein